MNYRHGYHAGNFCDVFKHLILMLMIEHFKQKEKGFTVLDAHAGDGTYSLHGELATKTGEAEAGILRALALPQPSPALAAFFSLVRRLGLPDADGKLTCYPGSPRLARALLRPQDALLLSDIHPDALDSLNRLFRDDRQVRIQPLDAELALKSQLPPPSRRALVLLDPPFEVPDEFRRLLAGLKEAHKRFPTGTYAIWYPIKSPEPVRHFHRQLAASGIKPILTAEIQLAPLTNFKLNGCGMTIVNPPWKLEPQLRDLLPELLIALGAEKSGETRLVWTVPE
ncbi:MAG TPA: 23S rRNA (adenine(2030)-N(6))-methyltransferase RlmJ [Sulfuricella sp.]|nr:23S rRNA (adenine(2030)-N(6))-methyltransferase RlmJ [Sulfuricella sp.]